MTEKNNISVKTEIVAGFTTFITMAYIIFVNPEILAACGMDRGSLVIITCLVTGLITLLAGLISKSPIAMAPGMGLNAFFSYSLVLNDKIPWETALGIVFISGLIFFILSLFGIRKRISDAIPKDLLNAIAVGIGVFIAFMGLQNMGLIVSNPNTMVSSGAFSAEVLIGISALLIIIIFEIKKIKGAILIGIIFATVVALVAGKIDVPEKILTVNFNITPVFGKLDIAGALKISFLAPVFTLMFMDMFDSIGSILGLAKEAEMMDKNGDIPKLKTLLKIDAFATMAGAVFGTSTTTTYIESAAGIESGGRTGLTSIVTGTLFLLSVLLAPLILVVPRYATAPALIIVGFYMIKNIKGINFGDIETGMPSFLIIIMIAFSYSISKGLAFGFIAYCIIKILKGKSGQINIELWVIFFLSILFFLV